MRRGWRRENRVQAYARRMASMGAREGGEGLASAAGSEGRRAGSREINKSRRQKLIWVVLASDGSAGSDSTLAISFLMTATEPKEAEGCTRVEAATTRDDGACSERTARVLVL